MNIIEKPLTVEEVKVRKDQNNRIKGILAISLDKILNFDGRDGFYDYVCRQLIDGNMQYIDYSIVGFKDDLLYIDVSGDVTSFLESFEE